MSSISTMLQYSTNTLIDSLTYSLSPQRGVA